MDTLNLEPLFKKIEDAVDARPYFTRLKDEASGQPSILIDRLRSEACIYVFYKTKTRRVTVRGSGDTPEAAVNDLIEVLDVYERQGK